MLNNYQMYIAYVNLCAIPSPLLYQFRRNVSRDATAAEQSCNNLRLNYVPG